MPFGSKIIWQQRLQEAGGWPKKKKESLTSLIHAGANEVFDCYPVPHNESVPLTLNASMERLRAYRIVISRSGRLISISLSPLCKNTPTL